MSRGTEVRVGGPRRRVLPPGRVEEIVRTVLAGERRGAQVSVTFLGRDAMRQLHERHLGERRPTDVLAFRLSDPNGTLVGDVYVCPWVAAREARERNISLGEELTRLIVHGTLHVLGFDHPVGLERVSSPMWLRQERYVRSLA